MKKYIDLLKTNANGMLVIIPLAYLFMWMNFPMWANIIACFLIYYAIGPVKEAIQKYNQKRKQAPKPFYVNVVIGNPTQGKFKKYLVPIELKKQFMKNFGTTVAIPEESFNEFILKNLSVFDGITYFAKDHQKQMEKFEKASIPANENHVVNKQDFYITYFDENNKLIVLNEIDGKKISQSDVTSWVNWTSKYVPRGNKFFTKDYNLWRASLKTDETSNIIEDNNIVTIKDGKIVGGLYKKHLEKQKEA
jgi:hypothetical protein